MCRPTNCNNKLQSEKKFDSLVNRLKVDKEKRSDPKPTDLQVLINKGQRLSYESSEEKGPTTANNVCKTYAVL
jgi:hypothetical protein